MIRSRGLHIKKIIGFLQVVLILGAIYFALKYGSDLFRQIDAKTLSDRTGLLVLTLLSFIAFYVFFSLHWLRVCRAVDESTKSEQFLSFFASQPFKYLPSSVFSFSFRAKYAKELGLSFKKSSLAQLIENFNIIGSGIVVSLLLYAWYKNYIYGLVVILGYIVVLATLLKIDFTVRVPKSSRKLSVKQLLPNFIFMSFVWVVGGISFLLANYALGLEIDPRLAISANAAGYAVSILAIFAPGGLGVRELTLYLFSVQAPAIILWRLITLVGDLLIGFGAVAYIKFRTRI